MWLKHCAGLLDCCHRIRLGKIRTSLLLQPKQYSYMDTIVKPHPPSDVKIHISVAGTRITERNNP